MVPDSSSTATFDTQASTIASRNSSNSSGFLGPPHFGVFSVLVRTEISEGDQCRSDCAFNCGLYEIFAWVFFNISPSIGSFVLSLVPYGSYEGLRFNATKAQNLDRTIQNRERV